MGQDDGVGSFRSILVSRERPSVERRAREHLKVFLRNGERRHVLGRFAREHVERGAAPRGNGVERPHVLAVELESFEIDVGRQSSLIAEHLNDAIGIGVWDRLQQNGIHDAEDGGVGPNAEREREQRRRRETWRAPERARAVAHILERGLDQWQTALLAIGVLHLRDSSELPQRGLAGFGR